MPLRKEVGMLSNHHSIISFIHSPKRAYFIQEFLSESYSPHYWLPHVGLDWWCTLLQTTLRLPPLPIFLEEHLRRLLWIFSFLIGPRLSVCAITIVFLVLASVHSHMLTLEPACAAHFLQRWAGEVKVSLDPICALSWISLSLFSYPMTCAKCRLLRCVSHCIKGCHDFALLWLTTGGQHQMMARANRVLSLIITCCCFHIYYYYFIHFPHSNMQIRKDLPGKVGHPVHVTVTTMVQNCCLLV